MVDEARMAEAERAYASGDYRSAAQGFLSAVEADGKGNGRLFHMAGNSLLKLGRFEDSITVYNHGLAEQEYPGRGALLANLATALMKTGQKDKALAAFDSALAEPAYDTRYRAYQGRAAILWDEERFDEAAAAYREAVLDQANPDPGKALNNLGLSYMKLGRPEEAVEAYKSAMELGSYKGKGRTAANLGLAYAALGFEEKAFTALGDARDKYGHQLAGAAEKTYQVLLERHAAPGQPAVPVSSEPVGVPVPEGEARPPVSGSVPRQGAGSDDSFFTRTEQDMKRLDKEARQTAKSTRSPRKARKAIVIPIVMAVALALAVVAAAFLGLGYPTQGSTVDSMFGAYREGRSVQPYWVGSPSVDVDKEMAAIPPTFKEFKVDEVDRGLNESTVRLTLTLDKGSPLHYVIKMRREGVGWKISGVANDWRSTGGAS